jgi:hypothetical protein
VALKNANMRTSSYTGFCFQQILVSIYYSKFYQIKVKKRIGKGRFTPVLR